MNLRSLTLTATVLAAAATLTPAQTTVSAPAPAASSAAAPASCDVARKVTTIRFTNGDVTRERNLTVTDAPFTGKRTVTRSRPGWRRYPVIVECRVLRDGAVTVRTARARIRFDGPKVTAPVVEPPVVVEPERPAVVGRWAHAFTVYAPIDATWDVDGVLAAWNAALPAGHQITRTLEPCTSPRTCVDVEVLPMADLYLPNVWGLAWWVPVAGTMEACSIDLGAEIPTDKRASVLAHEVGHCLGLPHWDHSGSVMTSAHSSHPLLPSPMDLQWVTEAYTG